MPFPLNRKAPFRVLVRTPLDSIGSCLHSVTRQRLAAAGLLLLGATLLSGCAPMLFGAAAVGTAATVHDRRPANVIFDDQQIELEAMSALLGNAEIRGRSQISATSYNRTLLLTGTADTTEVAQEAAALLSRIGKVQRVVDEIKVGPRLDLNRQAQDTYITGRVKTDLIGVQLPGFDPTRVKVVTSDGVVFLMGLVNPSEADAAAEKASYVPGVKRVVKLFEYVDDYADA
ncbi:BON domain-containing protein [Thiocapsa marina]|uniref:Transport-associated protein n=1 Tax=Thiocapsa marina 5811 TaxID=768671 RepID=F9U8F1_9GAMM|nr:BON domain-containing protein [Thiocapsa marina]EGV19563.1 transport-associated protein [Thiocapsa marina 5811]